MKLLSFTLFFFAAISYSQENNDYTRLRAINSNTIDFYNSDGIDFSSQTFNYKFSEKDLKKLYNKFSIKENDIKEKDDSLSFNNSHVIKFKKVSTNNNLVGSYYFVENKNETITVFRFNNFNKSDREFERKYINRILNNEIPKSVYDQNKIDSINFAGRKIYLGGSCYWTNVNTVQCPYYGEMNWSIHKTLESAKSSIENQFEFTKNQKKGKVISEEEVDVIFEGTETKAKKVVYDFTGITSALAGMSGGKSLTIYYVANKVRDNYVSCCMSFWNNDEKTESGLAPLLEKVMQIKK